MSELAASEPPPLLEVLQPGNKFMNRVYSGPSRILGSDGKQNTT